MLSRVIAKNVGDVFLRHSVCHYLFIYLFIQELWSTYNQSYKVKAKTKKIVSNFTAITGQKNAADVTPQRKHTEIHRTN